MQKPLTEMNLQELWTLFPLDLTEHQNICQCWYKEEKKGCMDFCGQ